jgi:hypothetical protein
MPGASPRSTIGPKVGLEAEMKRIRVEKKTYRPREDRYGEPLPLDPRELPFPFVVRRPQTPPSPRR